MREIIPSLDEAVKKRLACLLYERSFLRLPMPFLQFRPDEFARGKYPVFDGTTPVLAQAWTETEWPSSVLDKLDRVLCNLVRRSRFAGDAQTLINRDAWKLLFSTNTAAQGFLIETIRDRGWIDVKNTGSDALMPEAGIRVLAAGWEHFDQLTRGRSSSRNPAFVAMWFGGNDRSREMSELFDSGFKPAVEAAGYKVKRADTDEHNEPIMDRVKADIRLAPFVIAELTNQNNGVYFEAGFAAGLGLQVIPCCPKSKGDNVHFDLAQQNQIRWKDADDLRKKLEARILGSIGEGPFRKQQ